MKVDNQYSIRPWLSEKGKPSRVTYFKALAQLGLGNHTGAYAKPHSSSTSTGTVLESLHPGGEQWPSVSSAQDLLYFREEDLCIICGYIS